MFGNIVNNCQFKKLVEEETIKIQPFYPKRLKLAHYPLRPAGVLVPGLINDKGKRRHRPVHDFDKDSDEYTFKPAEYAIIEIDEYIELCDGIVGHFVPSSSLVDRGFGLTAGKLDPRYGSIQGKRQKLNFGVKNLKNDENVFSVKEGFAHIYLIDFRGLNNIQFDFGGPEMADLLDRFDRFGRFVRANNDGPDYDHDQEDNK